MSDETKAAEAEAARQVERWDALEAEYRAECGRLSGLSAAIREAKAEQRGLDLADPDDALRAREIAERLEALRLAAHAQRGKRYEARGRLAAHKDWLREPSTRKRRGGVAWSELRPAQ